MGLLDKTGVDEMGLLRKFVDEMGVDQMGVDQMGCYIRSIRGGSQSTPPGDKAWCIIAPIERYSGYRHFQ